MILICWRNVAYHRCPFPLIARISPWTFLSLRKISARSQSGLSHLPALRRRLSSTTFIWPSMPSESLHILYVLLRVRLVSLRSHSLILQSRIPNSKRSRGDDIEIAAVCDVSKHRAILVISFCGVLDSSGWVCTFRKGRSCVAGSIGQISTTRDFLFYALFVQFFESGIHFPFFLI